MECNLSLYLFTIRQEKLKELFPSWKTMKRHQEVLSFAVGLMKNPEPLVQYIYKMYLNEIRNGSVSINKSLFNSLYTESKVPIPDYPMHNKYLNYFTYDDTTPLKTPSEWYVFEAMNEDIQFNIDYSKHSVELPECILNITRPRRRVISSLLTACQQISRHQPITNLFLEKVGCLDRPVPDVLLLRRNVPSGDLSEPDSVHPSKNVSCENLLCPDVFYLNRNTESVKINGCTFQVDLMNHLMQQLSKCKHLCVLDLSGSIYLEKTAFHLVESVKSWGENPPLLKLNLKCCSISGKLSVELLQSISRCKQLTELCLAGNSLTGRLSSFLTNPHQELPELQKLDLSSTELNKEDMQQLSSIAQANKLPKLQVLNLKYNNITGSSLGFTADSPPGSSSLEELYLSNTNLNKEDLQNLSKITQQNKLPKLRVLQLEHNILTGCLSHFLVDAHPGLPSLEEIHLKDNRLNKDDLQHLLHVSYKLPKLKYLELQNNKLTGILSSFLADPHPGLPELEKLNLSRSLLNKQDLQHMTHLIGNQKLPGLTTLNLSLNELGKMEQDLDELIEVCFTHCQNRLHLSVDYWSEAFREKLKQRSEESNMEIDFV